MTEYPADANEASIPESPARARKIFWIKLLSLMAVSLLLVFVMYRIAAYHALNQRIQAVRDAGYPIEPAELNDWYATPEVNAADVYLRAYAAFPMNHETEPYSYIPVVGTVRNFVLGAPLDPEMAQRIEAYLALHTEAIALLEEASLIKGSRFAGDFREGINMMLPQLGQLRRSARILKLQSILEHDRGEHDLAAQRCLTILAIARALDNEPIIISGLVNISIQALAFDQIQMLVVSGQLSDVRLKSLAEAIELIDLDRIMLRAMVGERCSIHGIFGNSEMLAGVFHANSPLGRFVVGTYRTAGLLDIDHSSSLDVMGSYVEYAENPIWPMPSKLDDIDLFVPRICVVTRMMTPALSAAYGASRRCEAKRQAVLTGIAVERYRKKYGRFPTQLTELVPEFLDAVPMDPFDVQPLRYRTEDTGVIIYSIGADGTDDTGKLYNDDGTQHAEGADIPFTFGGLQELFWPQPEEEEIDYGNYGGYGDPYGGGYGAPYGPADTEDEYDEEDEETEADDTAETEDADNEDQETTPIE